MKKSFGLIAALIAIMFAALLLPGCPIGTEDTNTGGDNTTKLKVQNESSVDLLYVRWGNTVVSSEQPLAPSESKTVDVSEGNGYLYFIKVIYSYDSVRTFGCRTQEVITVTKDETKTLTLTNNTVVVDLDDTANVAPLGTITPRETKLTISNESSFDLGDIKWSNKQISVGLYPAESATMDVTEGTGYLYFNKYLDGNSFSCRTQEVIAVAEDETKTLTLTNNTVVVDMADTANVGPLGTITPRETKLTIRNQSSVTLVDIKWGNTVVSASLAPSESETVDVSEGTGYLFFTKGTANGLKCRTKDEIAVARNETTTQTMINTTVVIDMDDTANEASLETIARRETKLTIRNQSSVTLANIRWGNTVVSASLAPSESITVDVSEGTGYLYFTKENANGLKCRTKETIVVTRNETTTQTMINTTVVVDLDNTTNEGPLETIAPPVSAATLTWSGDWTRVSDTTYRSNAIGNSANTIERLNITASGSGSITIQLTASSEGADFGYASKLDTGVSTSYSDYVMRAGGTQVASYTYTIPSGSHWIQFMYQKDGSYTSGNDNVTVEIVSTTFTTK